MKEFKELKEGQEVVLVSKNRTEEEFGYCDAMLKVGDTESVLWQEGEKVVLGNKYVGKKFFYHADDLELVK